MIMNAMKDPTLKVYLSRKRQRGFFFFSFFFIGVKLVYNVVLVSAVQ